MHQRSGQGELSLPLWASPHAGAPRVGLPVLTTLGPVTAARTRTNRLTDILGRVVSGPYFPAPTGKPVIRAVEP